MAKKNGNKKARKRTSETGTPSVISPSLEKAIRTFAQVFKLLGDDTKLRILFCLAQNRELNVTALCNRLGQKQSPVSNSLSLLLLSDLVDRRREGKRTYYSVNTDTLGQLLVDLLSASGTVSKNVKFHDFTLTYRRE